jgi:hypothetical protein
MKKLSGAYELEKHERIIQFYVDWTDEREEKNKEASTIELDSGETIYAEEPDFTGELDTACDFILDGHENSIAVYGTSNTLVTALTSASDEDLIRDFAGQDFEVSEITELEFQCSIRDESGYGVDVLFLEDRRYWIVRD